MVPSLYIGHSMRSKLLSFHTEIEQMVTMSDVKQCFCFEFGGLYRICGVVSTLVPKSCSAEFGFPLSLAIYAYSALYVCTMYASKTISQLLKPV